MFCHFIDFFFQISTMFANSQTQCERREGKSSLKVNHDTNICKRLPKVYVSIGKWILSDPQLKTWTGTYLTLTRKNVSF